MWTYSKPKARQKVIRLPDRSSGQAFEPAKLPLKRRLLVLIAAIAVPAVAAPGDFGAMPADAPLGPEAATALLDASAMPFETPGSSFPGSAFYYLADPPSQALVALPTADPLDLEADGRELGELINAGPSAAPFFTSGAGTSHNRALSCMAQAVYYEAASESEAGQRAVAQVVLNRVAHPSWPASVCGVVYQGSRRSTGCQFTFTCDGSLSRKAGGRSWAAARRIATEALSGSVYEPIGHATHYHTLWVNPYWAKTLDHVGTIGAHRFYKTRGRSGRKEAFTQSYAGVEPGVAGRTTAPNTALDGTGPISSTSTPTTATFTQGNQRKGTETSKGTSIVSSGTRLPSANARVTLTPNSTLADPTLTGAGRVKDTYSNAGQWKNDAAAVLAAQEKERIESEEFAAESAPKP